MTQIAYAQQAGTVLKRTFIILNYICKQKKALRKANQRFSQVIIRKNAPTFIKKLRVNARINRRNRELNERAKVFKTFKSYEKVFYGLFKYSVARSGKNMNIQRAKEFYTELVLRRIFGYLKQYGNERKILQQKRGMMFKVIQLIDQQNLK